MVIRAVGTALTCLLAAGCGLSLDGPAEVVARNRSAAPVTVLVDEDRDSPLGTVIAPGASTELGWPQCKDAWVVVTAEDGEVLLEEERRMCPDDSVEVSVNERTSVVCGYLSRRERDC